MYRVCAILSNLSHLTSPPHLATTDSSTFHDKNHCTAFPYRNFSLQQSCISLALQVFKLVASFTRQYRMFITGLQQVKTTQTTKSPWVKLAVTLSCKFISN
ncbi:hypothetical protein AVEN_212042-1 [Araneus ventricosus]|uniref:Uncharacterized protein n=1 Tax=Araneus ventricosus TaxID=182803 RepID=A0A4Y2H340_ARAVE|nr:hypothetical protein AVEN_212042-1 [Araneus ventricosus]